MNPRARTAPAPRVRRRRRRFAADQAGFTLVEVLMATLVLVTGLTATFGLLDTSVRATEATRAHEGAVNLARQVLEDVRTIPYAQLSPGSVASEVQAMPGLARNPSNPTWQVEHRGIAYTLSVTECAIDDPKDGYGPHVNAYGENPFCSDSATTGTSNPEPEDFKRITVEVGWKLHGVKRSISQVQMLTAAGQSFGLTAGGLKLSEPSGPEIKPTEPVITHEPANEKLTFTVSAPTATAAMRWYLEGAVQSPDPTHTSGTTWTFSWPIPLATVSDGTYEVSVQAITSGGVAGAPLAIPVTLIRSVPAAPSGLEGGYNTIYSGGSPEKVVELKWTANKERNVIGYRAYNPSGLLVCPASTSTLSLSVSCVDTSPPSPTGSAASRTYGVVALYRNAEGNVLQSPAATLTVASTLTPPNPPENLTLTKNVNGSVTLRWTAPTSGEAVIFYRIYRGSTDYTGRYESTAGPATEFTDTDANVEHTYWVTAVDSNLTESSFLGPVTG